MPRWVWVLLAVACDGGSTESCDIDAVCEVAETSESWTLQCEEGKRKTACDCFLDDAKVGECDLDVCVDARDAIGEDRNAANASLTPVINDCCGTSYDPAVWDWSGEGEVVQEGCDVLGVGASGV